MHFFLDDLIGLFTATLLACLLMIAPGFAIAGALRRFLVIDGRRGLPAGWELLIGVALLPLVDALIVRHAGISGVILVRSILAAWGMVPMLRALRKLENWHFAALAAWWILVAWSFVDVDYDGRLYQSLLVLDLVKHAAVTQMIATTGVPLHDAFFLRDGVSGYYHYYYIAAAAIDSVGRTFVDSRMAFAATAFVTGLVFPTTLWIIAKQAGWVKPDGDRRFLNICIGLFFVGGLDIVPASILAVLKGQADGQIDWWDDEIAFSLSSTLWVPHHLAAVMAGFAAVMLLCHARQADRPTRAALVAITGMVLASAFGLSIWVALGFGIILALWISVDLFDKRFAPVVDLAIAGSIALILSMFQFIDLLSGPQHDGAVLALWIRPTAFIAAAPGIVGTIQGLAAIPVAYLFEFGFYLFGAGAFFQMCPPRQWLSQPLPRLLLVSAITAILLNAFVQSTIIYNDFGWRVAWLVQLPLMVWAAVALQSPWTHWRFAKLARLALFLGLAASVWAIAGWRFIRPPVVNSSKDFINARPDIDYEMRAAYRWANANLPGNTILQHNPGSDQRTFNFGLYSRHQVAVADSQAMLFGAKRDQVAKRVADISRIFSGGLAPETMKRAAHRHAIDYLLVSENDGIWKMIEMRPLDYDCVYRARQICILKIG